MKKMSRLLVVCFITMAQWQAFAQQPNNGLWRGELHYDNVVVPFQFSLSINKNDTTITLINAEEHKQLHGVKLANDSIVMPMGVFDADIKARFTATQMHGEWVKYYKKSHVPFTAQFDEPRFDDEAQPGTIESKWDMMFEPAGSLAYQGIGLWQQEGSKVTGTVLTAASDFRYFEGKVSGDSVKLSSFDGAHAFLILGRKTKKGWEGEMHFDKDYKEKWKAEADDKAELPNPWQIMEVEPGTQRPFYDILAAGSGKNAIDESKYFDKVLIIQLFGTWCPNSLDETQFLADWYKEHKGEAVEILGVSFEANYSEAYGHQRLEEYRDALNVPYPLLLGGQMSKGQAALAFPFMDRIQAFPTLVIVDKFGYVRYVHSYFNGPATGEYYEAFKDKFNTIIEELLAE